MGIALKAANEDVQNVIFKNMSKRLATMIKEDMEFMGPVRMKDLEEIVISRGGGDEIVV